MVKNKQFTKNMKKGTLIALSMGVGVSAVLPGMLPFQSNSALMKVHASDYVPGTMPEANAKFETEAGDVSHYNMGSYGSVFYHNGMQYVSARLPADVEHVEAIDGKLYGLSNTQYVGYISKYDEVTRTWETLFQAKTPLYTIKKTADGNFVASGGKIGTYGDDYTIYSSIGDDSSWTEQVSKYRSNSTNSNSTGAGVFHASAVTEDEAIFFGTSMNWTNIQTTQDADNFVYKQQIYGNYNGATYAGGKVIAVGKQISSGYTYYGSIATALPGGSFSVKKMGYAENFSDVTYGDGKYVVVGHGSGLQGVAYVSTDGENWTKATLPTSLRELNEVKYDEKNKRFVAVGFSGIVVSVDGRTWVTLASGQPNIKTIAIQDNVVDEYDVAVYELSKVTNLISNASYQWSTLTNTTELQAMLDSVEANEINAVTNETRKALLMEQVVKNQEKLDSIEVAISKFAEFQLLIEEERALVSPTMEEIEALRTKVAEFTLTLTEIPDANIRYNFTTYISNTLLENLKVKEAEIFVSRAEETLLKADYDLAYPKVSALKYNSTPQLEMKQRLSDVLLGIPVKEATVAVEKAEETLTKADYTTALSKVNALPTSTAKSELIDRLQMAYIERLEADLPRIKESNHYDSIVSFGYDLNGVTSTRADIVAKKAEVQADYNAFADAYYKAKFDEYLDIYIPQYGFSSGHYTGASNYFYKLTPTARAEAQIDFYVLSQMNSNITLTNTVLTAARNYTSDSNPAYLDAVAKVEAMTSFPHLKAYLTNVLEDLGTVKVRLAQVDTDVVVTYESIVEGAESFEVLRDGEVIYSGTEQSYRDTDTLGAKAYEYTVNAIDGNGETVGTKVKTLTTENYTDVTGTNVSGNVELEMSYQKDEAVTYEVLRNNEVIYQGENGSFVDRTAEGASNHTYQVKVKNASGAVIGTKEIVVNTAINAPTGTSAEETSETSTLVKWGADKNPENTEYQVTATPSGDFEATPSTTVEDFESATPMLPQVGNWARNTLAKKTGSYGLKSATIGHNGTTTSTYTIDVPTSVTDGKVSFDYRVSSEQNYDWFRVILNGTQIVRESGNGSWKTIERNLKPGKNTLVFEYKKDGSASSGSDAAFIDNLSATTASSGVETSGWIKEKEYEFTGLLDGIEYEFSLVAKANGLQSESVIVGANNPADDVREALELLVDGFENLDLSDLEKIADAQRQLDAVKDMANALPDGADKDELLAELAELQELLDNAKALAEAKQAVDAFIDALPEDLTTQVAIDEATAGLNDVQEMVEALEDGEEKTALVERLTEVEESIQLAQDILNATEAVFELMDAVATLETQKAIDEATALLENAQDLVSLLPADNTARIELEKGLVEAQQAIDVAQAVLDVAKLAEAPTQAEIDKALESLEKVEAGDVKDALLEKIELAQAVLDAKTLLDEIATREIATTEQVDQAIADLKSTDELIASLDGTFMDGEKSALEQAYSQAKKHIADEFLALLEDNKNQKGKKEKLYISDEALHLLVQQLVAENPEITKGEIKGQLQPLLASSVTGKQLNDVIAVYVN